DVLLPRTLRGARSATAGGGDGLRAPGRLHDPAELDPVRARALSLAGAGRPGRALRRAVGDPGLAAGRGPARPLRTGAPDLHGLRGGSGDQCRPAGSRRGPAAARLAAAGPGHGLRPLAAAVRHGGPLLAATAGA